MMLSSRRSRCYAVHPVHVINVVVGPINSAKRLPTLRPSQPTWAVNPPVACKSLHPPSPFIIVHQHSNADSQFCPSVRLSRSGIISKRLNI